jgi:transposase-like protein
VGEQRRRFDPEFRAGAVRIVKETGKPVEPVARDLGQPLHVAQAASAVEAGPYRECVLELILKIIGNHE